MVVHYSNLKNLESDCPFCKNDKLVVLDFLGEKVALHCHNCNYLSPLEEKEKKNLLAHFIDIMNNETDKIKELLV